MAAGLLVATGFVVLHALNELALGDADLLALDSETGAAAWFSATQFYAAGVLALGMAWLDGSSRSAWLLVGILYLGFSFDDIAQVHESTEKAADSRVSLLGLQPAVALITTGALVAVRARVSGPPRMWLAGSALLLLVALSSSIVNAFAGLPKAGDLVLFGVEEWSEMLMATLLIAAIVARGAVLVDVRRR